MDQIGEESIEHQHRKFLLNYLSCGDYFDSLFEFGCGAGANLRILSEKFIEREFCGFDINTEFYGQLNDLGVKTVDSVDDVDRVFDIVLVDAVLIYVPPSKVEGIINKLIGLVKNRIILFEWHKPGGSLFDGHWVHNYKRLLPGCVITPLTPEIWPDPGWQKYGAFIEWDR